MPDLLHRFESLIAERYEVERELGHGGMAVVYLARDIRHSRSVAIKVMRPEIALSLGTDRFLREIRIAAGLHHPNILALFDSGQTDGLLYFVMPYVAGETLRQRLEREQQLRTEDALSITRQVASALDYAHAQGVVHRDIKPENILLTDNRVCVADFGLARAVTTAAGERLTDSGIAMGTPAYMSPEQASADREVGARSDVYSLGCVVYEMFAGIPPFSGPNVQTIAMRHMTDTASPLRRLRPSTPEAVEVAVAKALEKVPADRFETASQLITAMEAPAPIRIGGGATPATVPATALPARRRFLQPVARWIAGVGAAIAVLATLWLAQRARDRSAAQALDASRYVVLPFQGDSGAVGALSGEQVSARVRDAFARWRGVKIVGELSMNEALRSGGEPLTQPGALRVARALGAGRLVWGRTTSRGDSTLVSATLFDVGDGRVVRERRITMSRSLREADARLGEMAASLLSDADEADVATPATIGTTSLGAARAFDRGRVALRAWDLSAAETHFRAALDSDATYSQASLWLAQVLQWSEQAPVLERRSAAQRAFALRGRMSPHDSTVAEGLLALAESRFPGACRVFDRLVAIDSTDVPALLGSGDCRSGDSLVLADARSPSRWAFRASAEAASRAYRRALFLVPSASRAFALKRLTGVLPTDANRTRLGFGFSGRDTIMFAAFPSLEHDTIGFVPYLSGDSSVMLRRLDSDLSAALQHNRLIFRDVAAGWVRAFPKSADALESLARALETAGELTTGSASGISALEALRRARELATDDDQRLRLAVADVRLRVKIGAFDSATTLADSLLAGALAQPRETHGYTAVLAVLRGRAHLAAQLLRTLGAAKQLATIQGKIVSAHTQLGGEAQALLVYSCMGGPLDSIRIIAKRVEHLLASTYGPREAPMVRYGVLTRPLSLAVPFLGPGAVLGERASGDYLVGMQQLLARGQLPELRRRVRALQASRTGVPSDVSPEAIFQESWILLAMGDTAAATSRLDASLDALPSMSARIFDLVFATAALPQMMVLRADIAHAHQDRATASRWAGAVLSLWRGADPELAPVLRRMQALAPPGR
ncbi:MAG: protein kinase [Gemmatimonadota bacterium]|nr:protein kinase [Gemmatimonadota bacterium]